MTRLASVRIGSLVRIGTKVGRLVRVGGGSAVVEVEQGPREFTSKQQKIDRRTGDEHTVIKQVKFTGTKKRETWALDSEVDVVEAPTLERKS